MPSASADGSQAPVGGRLARIDRSDQTSSVSLLSEESSVNQLNCVPESFKIENMAALTNEQFAQLLHA